MSSAMQEFTATGLNMQPHQIVKHTSEKRVRSFTYLKSLHQGDAHLFNTIKLPMESLTAQYTSKAMKKRSTNWFHLGWSLAPLLQISDPLDYVRSLNLLMEEYEYEVSDYARQKMRQIFRKSAKEQEEAVVTLQPTYSESDAYLHLELPNIPYELSYFQIVYTLCDLLVQIYQRLVDISTTDTELVTLAYAEAFLRLDSRFQKIIITFTKELDAMASELIKDELMLIGPLSKGVQRVVAEDPQDGNVSS